MTSNLLGGLSAGRFDHVKPLEGPLSRQRGGMGVFFLPVGRQGRRFDAFFLPVERQPPKV
jgi:hypothetical protein